MGTTGQSTSGVTGGRFDEPPGPQDEPGEHQEVTLETILKDIFEAERERRYIEIALDGAKPGKDRLRLEGRLTEITGYISKLYAERQEWNDRLDRTLTEIRGKLIAAERLRSQLRQELAGVHEHIDVDRVRKQLEDELAAVEAEIKHLHQEHGELIVTMSKV